MPTDQITISSLSGNEVSSLQSIEKIDLPSINQKELAWQDLKDGIRKWQIWFMLASQDIKIRYRRSVLGPLWTTLSMAITVYSMGYLYSHLFRIDMQLYFPYLVSGMLGWTLLLTLVLDFSDGFVVYHGLIRQIKLPYSLHIHRIATRNLIIFFHNLLVMIPIYLLFHHFAPINWSSLFIVPALLIIYCNSICYGIIIATISARYRDISQIIKSLMQVIFFLTPVMWKPQGVAKLQLIADINPLYAFLELIRQPLLGHLPTLTNISVVSLVTLIGIMLSFRVLIRYRRRIIYWL